MDKKIKDMVTKCKTVEEVIELAKSNDIPISKEKAEEAFKQTHCNNAALSDAELSNVSGGYLCAKANSYEAVNFSSAAEVTYILEIGQEVQVFNGCGNCTYTKVVDGRKITRVSIPFSNPVYMDIYHLSGEDEGVWRSRDEFEMPR